MKELLQPTTDNFKQAMSRFASGVCVITYQQPATGKPEGVTVSAFSSLSLNPIKVLFCLGVGSQAYEDFKDVDTFIVNILSAEQTAMCYQFAGKNRDNLEEYLMDVNGVPALKNTLATVVCEKGNQYNEGDHDIVIGEVQQLAVDAFGLEPLLYYKSAIIDSYQHKE